MAGAGPVSAYNAGIRAARAELAERAEASGDDKRLLAAQMLHTMTLRDDDDFERGYRDELAVVLNRWCRHCRRVFDEPNLWYACPSCVMLEYANGEGKAIGDTTRTHQLTDGFVVETYIEESGSETLWIVHEDHADETFKGRDFPLHEREGKLPDEFQVKVRRTRCGRMTRSGKPCRNGPWCKVHRH